MAEFKRGDQIIHIPTHAEGDPDHPACERGFIALADQVWCFCRFWHRDQPGQLRTRDNSERARVVNLKADPGYIPQEIVDAWLTIIDWENS